MADSNLTLKPVVAPGLGQPGYGQQIEKTFQNIEDNFKIVGNQEFIKGDQGYSLKSEAVSLVSGDMDDRSTWKLTQMGVDVLKAILSLRARGGDAVDVSILDNCVGETLDNVTIKLNGPDGITSAKSTQSGVDLLEYFTPDCMFNVIKVYDPNNLDDERIIGATNDFVFKDARFVELSSTINEESYSSLYDYTCTVHLVLKQHTDQDSGAVTEALECEVLQNYPTLYYDNNAHTFCWRVFNVETGIIARGPKGGDGRGATMHIVTVSYSDSSTSAPSTYLATSSQGELYKITKVLSSGRWMSVTASGDGENEISQATVNGWEGDACIAFLMVRMPNSSNTVYPVAFAGTVYVDNDSAAVFCGGDNCIQTHMDAAIVRSAFYGITFDAGANLNSIFIPIYQKQDLESTPVHAIWAAASAGAYQNGKTELHITPITQYQRISSVGASLSTMPDASTGSIAANNRLKTLVGQDNDHSNVYHDQGGIPARLNIDYPQVIISSATNQSELNNPIASLGIGVAFMDAFYTYDDEGQSTLKDVPRIKVGNSGVIQIGTDNNDGYLYVKNISSTNKNEECDLNLSSTSRKINIGGSTKITGDLDVIGAYIKMTDGGTSFNIYEHPDYAYSIRSSVNDLTTSPLKIDTLAYKMVNGRMTEGCNSSISFESDGNINISSKYSSTKSDINLSCTRLNVDGKKIILGECELVNSIFVNGVNSIPRQCKSLWTTSTSSATIDSDQMQSNVRYTKSLGNSSFLTKNYRSANEYPSGYKNIDGKRDAQPTEKKNNQTERELYSDFVILSGTTGMNGVMKLTNFPNLTMTCSLSRQLLLKNWAVRGGVKFWTRCQVYVTLGGVDHLIYTMSNAANTTILKELTGIGTNIYTYEYNNDTFSISGSNIKTNFDNYFAGQEIQSGTSIKMFIRYWTKTSVDFGSADNNAATETSRIQLVQSFGSINLAAGAAKIKISQSTGDIVNRCICSSGMMLMGAGLYRNMGVYSFTQGDTDYLTNIGPHLKKPGGGTLQNSDKFNMSTGLYMSFMDMNGKPCYAYIDAASLFKAVYGSYPNEIAASTNGEGFGGELALYDNVQQPSLGSGDMRPGITGGDLGGGTYIQPGSGNISLGGL